MPDLSVIVPVYNMAADGKLEYCMQSLVDQTLQSMEIIAVDDKSTDNSLEILRRFEKDYPGRVRVIASPENRKQGGARNIGIEASQGKYIGFMDADDWAAKDMYEKMVRIAETTGADAVGTDFCRVSEHTMERTEREPANLPSQVGVLDHDRRREFLLRPGSLVMKIYDRRIFIDNNIRFPEHMFYEDNATAVAIGMCIQHFELLPEANYFYYQHPGSTTHDFDLKKCEDRKKAMRIMLEQAKKNGALEEFPEVIEYQYGTLFYRNTLFTYMQGAGKKDPKFIQALGDEILESFPNFRSNPYFQKDVNDYEMKLINLQLKNTRWFLFIYWLKQISKKIRERGKS